MRLSLFLKSAVGVGAAACLVAPSSQAATLATGDPASAFTITVLADGLSQPTDMAELPDGRVVITQRLGDIVVINTDSTQVESGHINVYPEFGEQGLLGVVADPDFATNNTLYFYASAEPTTGDVTKKHKIYKITLGADGVLDSARNTIVDGLRASRSSVDGGASNHNGGGMSIYKGLLYVSLGDTGHNKTPPNNELGTCLNVDNGKILRFNLDGSTPDDNPLSAETMVSGCVDSAAGTVDDWKSPIKLQPPDKRIYAWGLRNPYRFWIDPKTERMWIGDVGETTREEVSVGSPLTAAGGKGEHYGWPFHEGTTNYTQSFPATSCMDISPARDCVPPVYDYGHSMNNNCVIGGLIPDGCSWAAPWNNRYFFGDNGSGRIWTLDVNDARDGIVANSVKDFASSQGIGSFRMGEKGVLYIAEVSGGVVDKITPKGYDPTMCSGSGGMGAGGVSAGGTSGGTPGAGTTGAGTGSGAAAGVSNGGTSSGGVSGGTAGASTGTSGRPSGAGTGGQSTGSGGVPGAGGAATSGTSSGAKAGTAAAVGGSSNTAGQTGSAGTAAKDSGGCGCRVASQKSGAQNLLALSALVGLALFRRKRARSAPSN